jgi:hypothetical protein
MIARDRTLDNPGDRGNRRDPRHWAQIAGVVIALARLIIELVRRP